MSLYNMDKFINSVLSGDCGEILKECPDQFFNMVFTSPPYADIDNKYKDGYKGVPPEQYSDWMIPKIKEFYRVLHNRGSVILNIDSKTEGGFESVYVYELICRIVKETGFKLWDTLFWNKMKGLPLKNRFWNKTEFIFVFVKNKGFTLNIDEMRNPYSEVSINRMKKPIKKRFARTEENQALNNYKPWSPHPKGALPSNLISISSESQRICDGHIAVFPTALPDYFIKGFTNAGDTVLDPFAGSGSTLVAAKQNNRKFCGIDISKDYVNFSIGRLNNE